MLSPPPAPPVVKELSGFGDTVHSAAWNLDPVFLSWAHCAFSDAFAQHTVGVSRLTDEVRREQREKLFLINLSWAKQLGWTICPSRADFDQSECFWTIFSTGADHGCLVTSAYCRSSCVNPCCLAKLKTILPDTSKLGVFFFCALLNKLRRLWCKTQQSCP